ncbi:hypothetical protein BH10BAC6_BH10BAC6_02150 [soil metagenome]
MIRHISEYIHCLRRLDSAPLHLEVFASAGCTTRELKILDMLISGQPVSDATAERTLASMKSAPGGSSYRKAITRLQQKLDVIIWNSLLRSTTRGKHSDAIRLYKHLVIGEVMSRVGSRLVAKRHLSQARLLATSADFITHELSANNLLLLLTSSQGDPRGTDDVIRRQAACLQEFDLLRTLDATLATMRACGTRTPARARQMESIAAEWRPVVEDLIRSSSSARVLTSVSRLAVAIAQVDAEPTIALRALDAHRKTQKHDSRWTDVDERDHCLQKAFVFQSVSMPSRAITYLQRALQVIRQGTLQWFTASESLLDCLLKACRFESARTRAQELRTLLRSVSAPQALRARIHVRIQYSEALWLTSVKTGPRRRTRIRGSNDDLHAMICRILIASSARNEQVLDELSESLIRAVTRSSEYSRDRPLVLFSRLLRAYVKQDRSLPASRSSKRFLAWEQEIQSHTSSSSNYAVVPWNMLWDRIILQS